jgi:hypothetical protein
LKEVLQMWFVSRVVKVWEAGSERPDNRSEGWDRGRDVLRDVWIEAAVMQSQKGNVYVDVTFP